MLERNFYMKIFLLALLVCFGIVVYYNKEELTTYSYGAYLKYWRLPYLKEDILECLKTGKPLSDYSKETIKLAIKKSPEFLALYLQGKLSPEQVKQAAVLMRELLSPDVLYVLCRDAINKTVTTVKECVQGVVKGAHDKLQAFLQPEVV